MIWTEFLIISRRVTSNRDVDWSFIYFCIRPGGHSRLCRVTTANLVVRLYTPMSYLVEGHLDGCLYMVFTSPTFGVIWPFMIVLHSNDALKWRASSSTLQYTFFDLEFGFHYLGSHFIRLPPACWINHTFFGRPSLARINWEFRFSLEDRGQEWLSHISPRINQ